MLIGILKNMIYIYLRKAKLLYRNAKKDVQDRLSLSKYHNKMVKDLSDFKRKSMTHSTNGRVEILKSQWIMMKITIIHP